MTVYHLFSFWSIICTVYFDFLGIQQYKFKEHFLELGYKLFIPAEIILIFYI